MGKYYRHHQANKLNRPLKHTQHGFTLLELLVVLIIMATLLRLSIGMHRQNNEKQKIRQETIKLARLIKFAVDYASLNSQQVGVKINPNSYFFVTRIGQNWVILKKKPLTQINLIDNLRLQYTGEQNPVDMEENSNLDNTPEIRIASSGELSEFKLRILAESNISYYELRGNYSGQIRIATTNSE